MSADLQIEQGKHLYTARKKIGLSGTQLGKLLNITPQGVSAMELGRTAISIAHLVKLYNKHNINPLYIIFGQEPIFTDTLEITTHQKIEKIDAFLKEKYKDYT